MAELVVPEPDAAHLAYHARMAASFAAAGDGEESAAEATLVWALLELNGGAAAARLLLGDLPDDRVAGVSPDAASAARDRARALALALQGHFASEGQSDAATLYERLAAIL